MNNMQDDSVREEIFKQWDPQRWKYVLAMCAAVFAIAPTPMSYGVQVIALIGVIFCLWVSILSQTPTAAHLHVPVKVQIERVSWLRLYRVRVWPQSIGWQDYQGQYTHSQIIWPWQWNALNPVQLATLLGTADNAPATLTMHFVCYHYLCAGRYERPANPQWYEL